MGLIATKMLLQHDVFLQTGNSTNLDAASALRVTLIYLSQSECQTNYFATGSNLVSEPFSITSSTAFEVVISLPFVSIGLELRWCDVF